MGFYVPWAPLLLLLLRLRQWETLTFTFSLTIERILFLFYFTLLIARLADVGRYASFGKCPIINPTIIGLRKHLVLSQFNFFSAFHLSP